MAKRQTKRTKSTPKEETKKAVAPEKVAASNEPKPAVSTLKEATSLVEKRYKHPDHLDYVVLSNGHVYFGINRGAALGLARKFGLKYFDVKF
jgi:hypothetical protein